ncbi:IS1380 family transposase [candidate division KSB1 bacterium]|nr:MAG: IS1380 family transposase [candidate division KSB1 bacterium]
MRHRCAVFPISAIFLSFVFTADILVKALLGLPNGINKDMISTRFKALGESGARQLEELNGRRLYRQIEALHVKQQVLDADSTVKTVYGNQDGAAMGYNPHKRGAKSYHPLLLFLSDTKSVVNSWFRSGSAYTSNGIVDFLKQSSTYLPESERIFFRADSGFFSGPLFDWLEEMGWEYLVKVKFKRLKDLLAKQQWRPVEGHSHVWICEFSYQCKDWKKPRQLKAVRRIEKYEEKTFFGKTEWGPVYKYACYCTNRDLDAWAAHECYKQRSTSENWIEQVKNQLLAGMTLTNDFWANDILWQLSVLAYNLSVMARQKDTRLHRQEHNTFRNWFIRVPAEFYGSRKPKLRLYEYYLFKEQWLTFADSMN